MEEAWLIDSLDAVSEFLPTMLTRSDGWLAFGQDSVVQIEGIAHPLELYGKPVYVCLTRFLPVKTNFIARRYCGPFAVRVLSGSYVSRWSTDVSDEIPPLANETRLLPLQSYASTTPRLWQGIEMYSDTADNLVVLGPVYGENDRPRTGCSTATVLLSSASTSAGA